MSDYADDTEFGEEETELETEIDDDEELSETSGVRDEVIEFQEKLMTKEKVYEKLYHKKYTTTNRLTKFERAAILGIRAEMIAEGGLHLDAGDVIDPRAIAKMELDANLLPMLIERPLPGKKGEVEVRRVADLHK
jgi:DNA-directed RNA polymerase subunit K/omega